MQGEPVAIPAPDAGDGVSPFSGSRDAHGPPDARAAAARRNSHAGPSLPVPIAGGIQINGYPQLYGSPPSPVDPQFSPPQGYFLARSPPGYFPAPGYVVPFGGQPFAQGYMVKGPMQMNMNMQPFPPQAGMPFQGGYPGPRAGPGIPPRVSPNPPSRAIPDGPEHESMGSVAFQQLSQGEGNRRSMSATPTAGMSGIGTRERVTSESAASDVTITGGPGAAASVSVSRKNTDNDQASAYTMSTLADELSSIEQEQEPPNAQEEYGVDEESEYPGPGQNTGPRGFYGTNAGANRPKKIQPPPGSTCRYYIQGRCWAGEQCRWSHMLPPYYYPVAVNGNGGPPQYVTGMVPFAYPPQQAQYVVGSPGGFGGDSPNSAGSRDGGRQAGGSGPRSGNGNGSAQCFYWRQGRCRFGEGCRFSHA